MAQVEARTAPPPMVTADGTPLKVGLARAMRRNKLRSLFLVVPLFLFILVTFFIPIVDMLFRSVENSLVPEVFHRTAPLLAQWDDTSGELPDEEVFAALAALSEDNLRRRARDAWEKLFGDPLQHAERVY